MFIRYAANNVGIYKDFLQKLCQEFEVFVTQPVKKSLYGLEVTKKVSEEVIFEAFTPLHDRLINLAMPQRERKESKRMRLKIIIAILRLIIANTVDKTQGGLPATAIKNELDILCQRWGEEEIAISNMTQELGVLHLREENRQTGVNFIPLFYFDKANKRLLILEPTIYVIKEYNETMLDEVAIELENNVQRPVEVGKE